MTLRLHISSHNDDLHHTTAKRNLAGGLTGLHTSGLVDNNLLNLPVMTNEVFRVNPGTGTCAAPEHINDNSLTSGATYSFVGQYAEFDFSQLYFIKQYRQHGHGINIGDGHWKIQYWNGSGWVDLETNIMARTTYDWGPWTDFTHIVSTNKIRLTATKIDNNVLTMSHINELQVTI